MTVLKTTTWYYFQSVKGEQYFKLRSMSRLQITADNGYRPEGIILFVNPDEP